MTASPLPRPRNVYCVGHNHRSLLADAAVVVSPQADALFPLLASKASSALTGPDATIPIQPQNRQVDWEAELVLQIAAPAFGLPDVTAARGAIDPRDRPNP